MEIAKNKRQSSPQQKQTKGCHEELILNSQAMSMINPIVLMAWFTIMDKSKTGYVIAGSYLLHAYIAL